MASKRRTTRTVIKDKDVQGTYYITAAAAKKLKAATLRGQPPGVQASKSDVVSFCLEESADNFTGARAATS